MIIRLFVFIFFPTILLSQNWTSSSNFIGDGRHHPITFSNDNFGFVVSGSYLNDMFNMIKLMILGLSFKIFQDPEEVTHMLFLLVIKLI